MVRNKKKPFLLFVFNKSCQINEEIASWKFPYEIVEFKPSFLKFKLLGYHGFMDFLIHFFWFLTSKGKYKIVYVKDNSKVIHYSYVLPKNIKFSFMSKYDLEIGPCFTEESYRGKGIYPFVLTYIIKQFSKEVENFYMIISEDNIASQRGVMKAGFVKSGVVYKDIIGIYKKEV